LRKRDSYYLDIGGALVKSKKKDQKAAGKNKLTLRKELLRNVTVAEVGRVRGGAGDCGGISDQPLHRCGDSMTD
jgi:hypothetical protein